MVNRTHVALKADDRSYFAILKKEVRAMIVSAGFSEAKVGRVDIIVAEMVSNLTKHADGGQILVKLIEEEGLQGIEIISLDSGRGMADANRMMADGVSTKNTLGGGLGAMKRLADVFQIYSQKDWGTVVLVRVFESDLPIVRRLAIAEVRTVILPKPGEEECGDGFQSIVTQDHVDLFLGDGLGHGVEAARAVEKAIEAFGECPSADPVEIIRYINTAVKRTRGLVAAVAIFSIAERKWRICGVGNIGMKINTPSKTKNYMSYNGIVGLNVPNTLTAQETEYEKGQYLVMCSDGLKSRWDTGRHPGVLRYDLSILAAALMKDFARNTDDMSVLTCKINL